MIRFSCPACKFVLQASALKAGDEAVCPSCGRSVLIPNPVKPASTKPPLAAQHKPAADQPFPQDEVEVEEAKEEPLAVISFSCPHCQTALRADPAYNGRKVTCGQCKQLLTVPNPPLAHLATDVADGAALNDSVSDESSRKHNEEQDAFHADFGSERNGSNYFLRFFYNYRKTILILAGWAFVAVMSAIFGSRFFYFIAGLIIYTSVIALIGFLIVSFIARQCRNVDAIDGVMIVIGFIGVVVSIVITFQYWGMDTTVRDNYGLRSIHNTGLMNDRLVGVIVGIGWTIASLLFLLLVKRSRTK